MFEAVELSRRKVKVFAKTFKLIFTPMEVISKNRINRLIVSCLSKEKRGEITGRCI